MRSWYYAVFALLGMRHATADSVAFGAARLLAIRARTSFQHR